MDAQFSTVRHAETEDVHVLARACADTFCEERDADPHEFATSPLLRLFLAQLVVPDQVHGMTHGLLILARVVLETGLVVVGELLRLDEILEPKLSRVHLQLHGEPVDHPLDQVHGLGDAERTGVGDAARSLVRVHRGDLAVHGLPGVTAGEHVEEPGRVLRRLRDPVECTVVRKDAGAKTEQLSVLRCGDLPRHDVVAGEGGGHQVLGAVLHPFDRFPGHNRPDDRQNIAGVNPDLVSETAADVRRDDLDLVLGDTRNHGDDRAVSVRGLRRHMQDQFTGDRIEVGHRTTRLHRGRMDARVHEFLLQNNVGLLECRLCRITVAAIPVLDVVVGATFQVVADDRRVRVERVPHINHRRKDVVVHVDQLKGVPCGVAVVRDDEGDLLTLEAHLVRRKDSLDVIGERGDPRQIQRLQILAGEHGANAWTRERFARVDGENPRVGNRRAQDRPVQHAREHDVIRVLALSTHETRVFLALQPAKAYWALRITGSRVVFVIAPMLVAAMGVGLWIVDDGHDFTFPLVTPELAVSAGWSAAH